MFVWMHRLDQHFPVRYSAWALCLVGLVASTFAWDAVHRPRCNAARGFMFALGCVQAQTCHTGNCPTGVTTQDTRRQQALDVPTRPSVSTTSTTTRCSR